MKDEEREERNALKAKGWVRKQYDYWHHPLIKGVEFEGTDQALLVDGAFDAAREEGRREGIEERDGIAKRLRLEKERARILEGFHRKCQRMRKVQHDGDWRVRLSELLAGVESALLGKTEGGE